MDIPDVILIGSLIGVYLFALIDLIVEEYERRKRHKKLQPW